METTGKLRFLRGNEFGQEAVAKTFKAEKMNIELLGNGDAHAHWHLFPRRSGDMRVMDWMTVVQSGGCLGRNGGRKIAKVKTDELETNDYKRLSDELDKLLDIREEEKWKKIHRLIWFAGSNPGSLFSRTTKNEETLKDGTN